MTNSYDREMSRRALLLRAGAGLTVLGLGASWPSLGTAATRASGGTLRFARSVAPTELDPANSIIAGDVYTLDKIFEPLYITSPSGALTPWLATGYTASNDQKTYTFALRPGVKFSDGSALTPEDVVFSINRSRKNAQGPLSFLDSAISSLEPSGADKVVVQLSEPWAPFLSDISVFANAIMPNNFGGKSEAEFFKQPTGTGPFTLSGFSPDASSLTLTKNPNYWQPGKPYLDAVELLYVDDDNQRVLQLRGGQVDLIDSVPPADVASLKSASGITVSLFPAWEVDLLVLNEKLPQFADIHVRRAITYAINRTALVAAASFGTAKPGGSFFPPSLEYYSASTPVPEFSLSEAKAELSKSAFPKGFKTTLLIDGGVQKWRTFAQIIQQALAPLNIDVSINALDHAAFESTFQKTDYDMFIDYAINDISDPDEMADFELDFKGGGSGSYWSSFNDPVVTKLVHQAESASPAARASLYAKIQALVAEEAPFVPLDYPPYIYAASTKVQGFAVNPGGAYRLEDVSLST